MNKRVFKGLKVTELSSVLAGPSVGLFFSELGATVTKIENKITGGDVTRTWKLASEALELKDSAYFLSVNTGKKHLFLDLTQKEELLQCHKLISKSDIVICNFKKGDELKLELDYKTLRTLNPGLIYASINGFGEESSRAAYDLILQAESGFMSINGEKDSNGLKMPVALIDLLAAHQLKEAILIALLKREKSGKGSKVSVSLFDSAIASLANQATNWLVAKELPKPSGSLHPNIAPYGEIFTTRDKQRITLAIGNDKQFIMLMELLELKENLKKFGNNQLRVKNRDKLYSILHQAISKTKFSELYTQCIVKGIPIGKIRNLKEVFELKEVQSMIKSTKVSGRSVKTVKSIAFKGI